MYLSFDLLILSVFQHAYSAFLLVEVFPSYIFSSWTFFQFESHHHKYNIKATPAIFRRCVLPKLLAFRIRPHKVCSQCLNVFIIERLGNLTNPFSCKRKFKNFPYYRCSIRVRCQLSLYIWVFHISVRSLG